MLVDLIINWLACVFVDGCCTGFSGDFCRMSAISAVKRPPNRANKSGNGVGEDAPDSLFEAVRISIQFSE